MSNLSLEQLTLLKERLESALDMMEDGNSAALCLVHDHIATAVDLLDVQNTEIDRAHLNRCFDMGASN